MTTFFLILILVLNVAISWWNCYVVGSAWKDAKVFGSRFDMALLYSAAFQSVAGFSVPILLALTWVVTAWMGSGNDPSLTQSEIKQVWEGVFSLWYVGMIIPIVGTGMIIWVHSVKVAYEQRDLASIGVAGYNTIAQISNTVSMFNNLGPAMDGVGSLFKGNSKNTLPLLVIMLVIVALLSSLLLTVHLIQYYAKRAPSHAISLMKKQAA